jgi:hypothetical protein
MPGLPRTMEWVMGGRPSTWPSSDGVFEESTLPTRPSRLLRSEPKNLVSH